MKNEMPQLKELSLKPVKRVSIAGWGLFIGVVVLPILIIFAYFVTNLISQQREDDIARCFGECVRVFVKSKAEGIDTWLENSNLVARHITNKPMVQMFASDVNKSEFDIKFSEPLSQQTIYVREYLSNFVTQNNLLAAYLINEQGRAYLSDYNAKGLPQGFERYAQKVYATKKAAYSPIRMEDGRMLVDIYTPIFALNKNGGSEKIPPKRVVGVLAITFAVRESFYKIMDSLYLPLNKGKFYLFQEIDGVPSILRLEKENEGIVPLSDNLETLENYENILKAYSIKPSESKPYQRIIFGQEQKVVDPGTILRTDDYLIFKRKVQNAPLVVMSFIELKIIRDAMMGERRQMQIIGQLSVLVIFVILLGVWWRNQRSKQKILKDQYDDSSIKLNAQRQLTASINATVAEHIALKYFDGKYVYGNQAFAAFFGLTLQEIIGMNDVKLYGEQMAAELEKMDKALLKDKKPLMAQKSFIMNDKRYHLQVSKTPFLDGAGRFVGITTVIHDITDAIKERQLREKAMRNSMRSMMHIMERYDDHLMRHTKYLRMLVVALGAKLKLPTDEMMTLEICANLSQIGKIYIPKEILVKDDDLNKQDKITYQTHIENTAYILDAVDWELPVVKTVYSMYEYLDGSGYPNGLMAEDIPKLSRLLCVCEVFTSLVSPRHGRKVYTPEEAIKYIASQKGKFDLAMVQALAEMIRENGEVILSTP